MVLNWSKNNNLFIHLFICLFANSFIQLFIHWFNHSIHSCIFSHLFIDFHPVPHQFTHHLFIHFHHSFIHSLFDSSFHSLINFFFKPLNKTDYTFFILYPLAFSGTLIQKYNAGSNLYNINNQHTLYYTGFPHISRVIKGSTLHFW